MRNPPDGGAVTEYYEGEEPKISEDPRIPLRFERQEKAKAVRTFEHLSRQDHRLILEFLRDGDVPIAEIADDFGVKESEVRRWISRYKERTGA